MSWTAKNEKNMNGWVEKVGKNKAGNVILRWKHTIKLIIEMTRSNTTKKVI